MGLFGDLDVNSANDNPFFKPDGTYSCVISKIEVKQTKSGDKVGMNLVYKIVDGPKIGREIKEWKWIPSQAQLEGFNILSYEAQPLEEGAEPDEELAEKASQALSFLKSRMRDFGIPADKINDLEPDDLLEKFVDITIRNKDGNERIYSVSLSEEDVSGDPFGG